MRSAIDSDTSDVPSRSWNCFSTSSSFGATVINGDGLEGEVRLTFCVVPRKKVKLVTALAHSVNPGAYVTVDQTSSIDLMARHGREVRA